LLKDDYIDEKDLAIFAGNWLEFVELL